MPERIDRERRRVLTGALQLALAVPLAGAAAGLWSACGEGGRAPGGEAGGEEPTRADAAPAGEEAPSGAEQRGGGEAPGAEAGGQPAAEPAADALVTEIPAMQATVESLGYVNQSTQADQRCANCQFYTAQGGGRGKCQLFSQGLVQEGGWCRSWTAKVG